MYVTVPAPWQRTDVAPKVNIGVPTDDVIVTVCVEVLGPLHPVAVAVIVDVPLQPASYVTAPVVALLYYSPAKLVASRLYVIPVLLLRLLYKLLFLHLGISLMLHLE